MYLHPSWRSSDHCRVSSNMHGMPPSIVFVRILVSSDDVETTALRTRIKTQEFDNRLREMRLPQ